MTRRSAHDLTVDLHRIEELARARLDPAVYDWVAAGADDERTLADNVAGWDRYRLRPRMLRDVSQLTLGTTVLGTPISAPMMVAPTAYHRLTHPDGEPATAVGAAVTGTIMVVSTMASVALEDVARAGGGAPQWFQLYVHTDRALTESLVRRAETAGFGALVVTVDTPRLGDRRRTGAAGFVLPDGIRPANLPGRADGLANVSDYAAASYDESLTPEAITWLCAQTSLPVVVKGILRGDDALTCIQAGAAAIMVSNHGARQLDGAICTVDALVDVVAAVGAQVEVYVDGGVRRGTDVLRALALGARAVLLGRPIVWGHALAGADGVRDVLLALRAQTELAFALAGVRSCADAGPDLVTR